MSKKKKRKKKKNVREHKILMVNQLFHKNYYITYIF